MKKEPKIKQLEYTVNVNIVDLERINEVVYNLVIYHINMNHWAFQKLIGKFTLQEKATQIAKQLTYGNEQY